jgi:hypothetical protein
LQVKLLFLVQKISAACKRIKVGMTNGSYAQCCNMIRLILFTTKLFCSKSLNGVCIPTSDLHCNLCTVVT